MSKKGNIINQLIYHSLEVKLAKSLKRNADKLKPATKALLGDKDSHKHLVSITELILTLQLEIDRHMKILVILAKDLLKMCNLTTEEIDAESIVPFKLKDIEQGYIEIKAPVNSNNTRILGKYNYYIILSLGEILPENDTELEFFIRESYSQVPKGYKLLLLI